MKKLKLEIADQAISDLEEIWLYIAGDSPTVADLFINRIYEECQRLRSHPDLGRERPELLPGMRGLPYKRYVIFYRIVPDEVQIVRVLSGYRDVDALT